jgi:MFS transporter, FHS family, Na+ dependent glucose transporter 1
LRSWPTKEALEDGLNNKEKDATAPFRKDIYYFIIYGVCFISLGLAMASLGPILPFLAETTSVSISQISFVFSLSSLGYLTGSAGGGRLYDKFSPHLLMGLALGLMIIIGIFIPLSNWYYLLLLLMFLYGLGQGLLDVGGNVNLVWVYQSRVGPYMTALHFFFGVGAFLSPIIITNVMQWAGGGLTWPLWAITLLFIPGWVGLVLLKSPKRPEKRQESVGQKHINRRLVFSIMILFFLYVGVENGFGGWIFTYAVDGGFATEVVASYLTSLFWGALTLGRLVSIPLAKKLSPSTILIGNFALSVVFLGLIVIWPNNNGVIWISAAGLGMAQSSAFPTLMSMAESRLHLSGGVTGLFFLGGSLGGTFMPMALGQIFEFIGAFQIILFLFGASILGLIILLVVVFASNRSANKNRYSVQSISD